MSIYDAVEEKIRDLNSIYEVHVYDNLGRSISDTVRELIFLSAQMCNCNMSDPPTNSYEMTLYNRAAITINNANQIIAIHNQRQQQTTYQPTWRW